MPTPYVVGVTGGIATGKSAVMATLAQLGAECIDADRVYHELVRPGQPLLEQLRGHFGTGILAPDGQLDRKALASIVFTDAAMLRALDAIAHPAVIAEVGARLTASTSPVVAVEAVKLIESGMDALCDEVWLVVADQDIRLARLNSRNELPLDEAQRRLAAQPNDAGKRHIADHIIENSGSLDELRVAVTTRWRSLPWDRIAPGPTSILPK